MTVKGALTRKAAAEYLSISTRTLDKLVRAGELAKYKLGSKTVFRPTDLDVYLQSKLVPAKVANAMLDAIKQQINQAAGV